MTSKPSWLNLNHIWLPYTQMLGCEEPLPVVRASGVNLFLQDGSSMIDGISSWWTVCHGHQHPHIVNAIQEQASSLSHTMFAGLAHEQPYRLAERLSRLLPGDLDHVFFSESGSVSVEIAVKIALQYARNCDQPQRNQLLSFQHGYHGDTFMSMSLTDQKLGMHDAWQSHRWPVRCCALPVDDGTTIDFHEVLANVGPYLAAIIVEPLVQGAGGFRMHDSVTLQKIRQACDHYGVLMIADEIMTGFGRTGSLFACQQADVVPDLICLSKALTGGTLPLSATVARRKVFDSFSGSMDRAFMHGPTYMGNAMACAAANASLDLFDEYGLDRVKKIEVQLKRGLSELEDHPDVVDIRVKGAIGAVELKKPASILRPFFISQKVWLRPFDRVVYIMPPLIIDEDSLQKLIQAVTLSLDHLPALSGKSNDAP